MWGINRKRDGSTSGQRLKRKSFPASTTKESNNKSGVTKREAYGTLSELYAKAVVAQPGLSRCKDFRAAIIRMSEAVKDTKGTSGGGTVMRDEFKYSGKSYRIDLENLRGINLVE